MRGGDDGPDPVLGLDAYDTLTGALDQTAFGLMAKKFGWLTFMKNGKIAKGFEEAIGQALKNPSASDAVDAITGAARGLGSASRLLDGRVFAQLSVVQKSKVLAGALDHLGVIGLAGTAIDGWNLYNDFTAHKHIDVDGALEHGANMALTLGAAFLPPPGDIICGGALIADTIYNDVPVVHIAEDVGSSALHVTEKAGGVIKSGLSHAYHGLTHLL